MNKEVDIKAAYRMMQCFLEKYYSTTLSDDIGALLGDLLLFDDEKPMDPAIWEDWVSCFEKITK